jgi:diaminopimelate epimerase
MKFTKMHGLGNDYVYVNAFVERVDDPVRTARQISNRHTGIGSDGLILIAPSSRADVRMEMYNADGSRGRMCGNGIRCVAKYSVEHGLAAGPELRIETDSGVKKVWCHTTQDGKVAAVRVDMGPPILSPKEIPVRLPGDRILDHRITIGGVAYQVTCVSMGNPHAVVFVDDLDAVNLAAVGPAFETAECFPQQVNVHFARVETRWRITMQTWERGSGATRACGTGACAVGVAGCLTLRTERKVAAALPGGELEIEWAQDGNVYMTGPAVEVFRGEW